MWDEGQMAAPREEKDKREKRRMRSASTELSSNSQGGCLWMLIKIQKNEKEGVMRRSKAEI